MAWEQPAILGEGVSKLAWKSSRTSAANGRLWGARAQEWAEIQEGVHRPYFEAVLERAGVVARTKYLDVGCGSGLAAPPPGAPGPFALSNKDALRQLARDAGLLPVDIFDVDCPFEYPDVDTAVRGLCSAGVSVKAAENTSDAAVEEAYRDVISRWMQSDGSVSIRASFRCLLARRGGLAKLTRPPRQSGGIAQVDAPPRGGTLGVSVVRRTLRPRSCSSLLRSGQRPGASR
ncbi:MAG: hypothetical protein ACI8WY_001924 [Planctomycetota bacterium]